MAVRMDITDDSGAKATLTLPAGTTLTLTPAPSAAPPTTTPPPTPTPAPAGKINLPSNARIRGLVIGPQFVGAAEPGWDTYHQMWYWFNANNGQGAPDTTNGTPKGYGGINSWWKPALDAAATVGNCVRIIGNPNIVQSKSQTIDQYMACWKALLDYARTKRLYVYATNIGFERWGSQDPASVGPISTAWAQLLKGYTDIVIGVDVSNEVCWSTSSGLDGAASPPSGVPNSDAWVSMLLAQGAIIRQNSGLPVTYSASITAQSQVPWDWYKDGWFPHSMPLLKDADFMDFHLYANPMLSAADLAKYYTNPTGIYGYSQGKQQIHAEFGVDMNQTAASRTAFVQAVSTAIAANTFDLGGLLWQNYDFNGSNNAFMWGLWPNFGQPIRTDISKPFATIPLTR